MDVQLHLKGLSYILQPFKPHFLSSKLFSWKLQPGMYSSAPERCATTSGCEPSFPSFLLPESELQTGPWPVPPGRGAPCSSQPEKPNQRGPHATYSNQRRQRSSGKRSVVTSKRFCNQQQKWQRQQCALQPLPASPGATTPGCPPTPSSCQQHLSTSASKWTQ